MAIYGRSVAGIGMEIDVDYLSVIVLDLMSETVLEHQRPLDVPSLSHAEILDQLTDLTRRAITAIEGRSGQAVGVDHVMQDPTVVSIRATNEDRSE